MKTQLLVYWLIILFALEGFAQEKNIYEPFDIPAGHVGFDILYLKDFSRPMANKSFRHVQVALWFPISNNTKNLKLKDYLSLYLNEEDDTNPNESDILKNESFWGKQFKSLNKSVAAQKLLDTEMLASKQNISNLTSAKKNPLIIYAAGGQGESFENAVMCEYLASKGFVVAAIPSIGTDKHDMNTDIRGLNSQIRDMELVINGLSGFASIDLENIGVMGWSWGGLGALGLQVQNKNIKAVASLDGSIAGYEEVIEKLPGYALHKLNVPYLFFATEESTITRVQRFFNKLKYSDASLISVSKIDHANFSGYRYLASVFSDNLTVDEDFYPLLTKITTNFFSKNLIPNDTSEIKELASSNEDLIALFLHKGKLPSPLSEAEFIELITIDGIEKGKIVYNEIKARDSSYVPFEAFELTKLAFKFARDSEKKDQAIPIMELVLLEYPKSFSSYALKARIHEILEENIEALEYFGKAYGLALKLAQLSSVEETVFYKDINWYEEKIGELKEKLLGRLSK